MANQASLETKESKEKKVCLFYLSTLASIRANGIEWILMCGAYLPGSRGAIGDPGNTNAILIKGSSGPPGAPGLDGFTGQRGERKDGRLGEDRKSTRLNSSH